MNQPTDSRRGFSNSRKHRLRIGFQAFRKLGQLLLCSLMAIKICFFLDQQNCPASTRIWVRAKCDFPTRSLCRGQSAFRRTGTDSIRESEMEDILGNADQAMNP